MQSKKRDSVHFRCGSGFIRVCLSSLLHLACSCTEQVEPSPLGPAWSRQQTVVWEEEGDEARQDPLAGFHGVGGWGSSAWQGPVWLSFLPTIYTPNEASLELVVTSSVLVVWEVLRTGVEWGELCRCPVGASREVGQVGGVGGGGQGKLDREVPLATQFTNPTSCVFVCLSR